MGSMRQRPTTSVASHGFKTKLGRSFFTEATVTSIVSRTSLAAYGYAMNAVRFVAGGAIWRILTRFEGHHQAQRAGSVIAKRRRTLIDQFNYSNTRAASFELPRLCSEPV